MSAEMHGDVMCAVSNGREDYGAQGKAVLPQTHLPVCCELPCQDCIDLVLGPDAVGQGCAVEEPHT